MEHQDRFFPLSGQLIGFAAEHLRLKDTLRDRDDLGYSSAQRYLRGERVAAETRERVVAALAEGLPGLEVEPREAIASLVRGYAWRWDAMCAGIALPQGWQLPQKYRPVPFLRLFSLELGIRWGALHCAEPTLPRDGFDPPEGFRPDALARRIDAVLELEARQRTRASGGAAGTPKTATAGKKNNKRGKTGKAGKGKPTTSRRQSLKQLARGTGVSHKTLADWRAGRALPTSENLRNLAAALLGPCDRWPAEAVPYEQAAAEVELSLRVALLGQSAYRALERICGRDRLADFISAFTDAARWTFTLLQQRVLVPEERVAAAYEVAVKGASSPGATWLLQELRTLASLNQEVQLDLDALAGDWTGRLRLHAANIAEAFTPEQWQQTLRRMEQELPGLATAEGTAERFIAFARKRGPEPLLEHTLRMGRWATSPAELAQMSATEIKCEGAVAAHNRMAQAAWAKSAGDLHTALSHLRRAVTLDPTSAKTHLEMGGVLGELVLQGEVERTDEAVGECHIADQLDPGDTVAIVEVGIILSNAKRREEAEQHFAAIEPRVARSAHYHMVRGNNLLELGRFLDAEHHLRRSLKLGPMYPNHAKIFLARCLHAQGKVKEAKRLFKEAEHATGAYVASQRPTQ